MWGLLEIKLVPFLGTFVSLNNSGSERVGVSYSTRHVFQCQKLGVCVNGQVNKVFEVTVGIHQGSVLSPLLFIIIIVLEALSHNHNTKIGAPIY